MKVFVIVNEASDGCTYSCENFVAVCSTLEKAEEYVVKYIKDNDYFQYLVRESIDTWAEPGRTDGGGLALVIREIVLDEQP